MSSIADQFKAAMESPDCECMGCRLRRLLEADGFAGLPVVVITAKQVNEGPAEPKPEPKAAPAPRRSLFVRVITWLIRSIHP